MSFLNPVNEPVTRFSSTDADAPQINYNARTAGDVKAVLKACLVTGYGDKASAGWSIVNEVDHVCEFVSPSAAMSDYRFGIDDTSTSSTTWYYQYQNTRTNPNYNTPSKSINQITKTHEQNRWELIVTNRGFYFVEVFYHTASAKNTSRVTWIGQVKTALKTDPSINISFFCTGLGSQMFYPAYLAQPSTSYKTYNIASYTSVFFSTANLPVFADALQYRGVSIIDLISEVYLIADRSVIAQQTSLLLKVTADNSNALGVDIVDIDSRPILAASVTRNDASTLDIALLNAQKLLIRLDYWEY